MLRWQHPEFQIVDPNWHRSDSSTKSANGSRAIERWKEGKKQNPSLEKEKEDAVWRLPLVGDEDFSFTAQN